MSITTPEWVRDAVFYQIFPDRFAKSDLVYKPHNLEEWSSPPTAQGFKGGDFIGMYDHLDYLSDLGVNAIYFTPIFTSTANHRYHTFDYFTVDPILGGRGAFRKFLDAAHERSIKVVLDGVFNHASRGFYQFNHTLENGLASPYLDWFYFNQQWLAAGKPLAAYGVALPNLTRNPDKETGMEQYGFRAWWDIPALPKFNTENPDVREFILNVATYWLDFGIDGWRLDVPHEIDDDAFWQEFRRRVKTVNPEAYICGEIWGDARRWLQGDQFDAVMNYILAKAAIGYFMGPSLNREQLDHCGYRDIQPLTLQDFQARIADLLALYPRAVAEVQMNLLGSHDTPRLLTCGGNDLAGAKLAYTFLLTFVGAPCIYYGDEIGMVGDRDPGCRGGFIWDQQQWNTELRAFIKRCIQLRHQQKALRRGGYRVLLAKDDVYIYERYLDRESVIVALNASTQTQSLVVPLVEQICGAYKEAWSGAISLCQNGRLDKLSIAPRGGVVLVNA